MALKTFVKISGINNLSDARYCAGMGADILGFSFDPSEAHYLPPEQYTAITGWISGVQYAAEFNVAAPIQIEQQLTQYEPVDLLQVSDPAQVSALERFSLPVILKLELNHYREVASIVDVMQEAPPFVQYFLLEKGEDSKTNWLEEVLRLASRYPILLGFGVTPDNVLPLTEDTPISGIALQGSQEIRPGYKSFDDLADILERLEVDDM